MNRNGIVYTFYSHKGGAGRTMLLANVAVRLAEWGHRVLCVDLDIDAPGLDRYFRGEAPDPALAECRGVLDWALDVQRSEPGQAVPPPEPTRLAVGAFDIWLVSAGRTQDYHERLDRLSWPDLDDMAFGEHLEEARRTWVRDFDFILVDARAGSTTAGAVATSLLADDVVLVSPPTWASIEGCKAAAARIRAARAEAGYRTGPVRFLAVQSRVDVLAERDFAVEWLEAHVRAFRGLHDEWTDASPSQLVAQVRIPHVSYWAFGERLPVRDEDGLDPLTMSWAYNNVAALLAHRLDGAERLLERRTAYLRSARPASSPMKDGDPAWWRSLLDLVRAAGGWGAYDRWRVDRSGSRTMAAAPQQRGQINLDHFQWLREVHPDATAVAEIQATWEFADSPAPGDGWMGPPATLSPSRPRPLPTDLGLCLVVDIANYATAGRATQQAMMRFLLDQVLGMPVLAHARRGKEFHVQSAGDGFLLVLDPKLAPHAAHELVRGAFGLIDGQASFARRFQKALEVRVALNRVSWAPGLAGFRDANLMEGSGFGTVQLVAALAQPAQVVATEEFVQELLSAAPPDPDGAARVFPPVTAEPWVVPLRNREEVRFRLLCAPGSPDSDATVPPVISLHRAARDRLREELYSQLVAVSGTLGPQPRDDDASPAQWRVRLWCPDPRAPRRLVASTFGLDQNFAPLPPSRISWSLEPRPLGPPARAYLSDKPQWIVDLPPVGTPAYFARWRRIGLAREQVSSFTRAPRSILAIPFGLLPAPAGIGGVVCLDCDAPLKAPSDREIREVLRDLHEVSSPYVAALWALITA